VSSSSIPTLDEQQAYYDERWPKEPARPNRLELSRLIEILKALYDTKLNFATERVRICDLGCGRGWISAHLSSFASVTGVDLSIDGITAAQEKWPQVNFVHADVTKYRDAELFDIVISSEVIEHVLDKTAFIETAYQILRPGGHLIITTPNKKLFQLYLKSGAEIQPIEDWLSLSTMRALVEPKFTIIRHETFLYNCFYKGIFRVISAPKVIAVCKAMRVEIIRRWIFMAFDLGLHQILYARRWRRDNPRD
jgi:2-polyprenyl-3-methyl-5-hydroxy-6-metoxy-1,4-benzoquinol methylase